MADFPPWINNAGITAKGTGPRQQNSTEPAIDDLYKSPTIFINGVPVVLYNNPTANGGNLQVSIAIASSVADTVPVFAPSVPFKPQVLPANSSGSTAFPQTNAPTINTNNAPSGLLTQLSGDIKAYLDKILAEAIQWTRGQAPLGPGGNQNIVGIFKSLNVSYAIAQGESVPWCAGFVNFVLKNTGYVYTQDLGVDAFYDNPSKWHGTVIYDRKTKGDGWKQAQPGDICIWDFGPKPPHHTSHVNFVYDNLGSKLQFCGGNQGGKTINNSNPSGSSVTNANYFWSPSSDRPGNYSIMMIFRPSKRS